MHSNVGVEPERDRNEGCSIASVLASVLEPDTERWASKGTDQSVYKLSYPFSSSRAILMRASSLVFLASQSRRCHI